ncbi:unnamed protein product [Onchocerca flexuosa]|uniref:ANK_REP_REGION domain-containing protein n=1 Tax=Onchocerca flexuosa TaxID=387005 RepID=A0A183I6Q4_9BILA|nr:unnamed protein product [Onchocerca flexuosa]
MESWVSDESDCEFDESTNNEEDYIFPWNCFSHLPVAKLFDDRIYPSFCIQTETGPEIDYESKSILPFLQCLCRGTMRLTVRTFLEHDIDINAMRC